MSAAVRPVRAAGFTLLPVILAMSLIAAIAFLLNRDNGVNARMIANRSDLDRARYAAEAGLQAVNFVIQSQSPGMGCTGTNYPTSGTVTNFFGATYSAYASKNKLTGNPPPPIGLVSTGSYNGASVTLTRDAYVYQSPMTIIVRPGDSLQPAGYDTYLDGGSSDRNFGGALVMKLSTTPSNLQPLLKFDLRQGAPGGFPLGSRAIPWYGVDPLDPPATPAKLQPGAKLSLYMSSPGSAGSSGSVNAQLITQNWVAGTGTGGSPSGGATWLYYDYNGTNPQNKWPSPGVGYASTPVASTPYPDPPAVGWYHWDLTNAAAAWLSGVYPNNGIWLVGSSATGYNIGNTDYVSSNSTAKDTLGESARPKLTLNTLIPCGYAAPPSASDTTPGPTTTVTLSAVADTYITAGTILGNYGKDTTMYVGEVGTSPNLEQRMILKFDLSGISPGKTVTSATLRLLMNKLVGQAGANSTKSLDAYALTQSFVEGTSQSSGNIYGATWASRDYCCQWTPSWGGTYDTATTYATGRVESSGVSPLPGSFNGGWVTWNLTALAQGWVDGVIVNNGILVKSRYPGDITYSLEFLTKENNSAGGKYAPQLVVVYQ